MQKTISWFEIPAADLDRAQAFYQTILGIEMQVGEMGPVRLAVFPHDRQKDTGGCVQLSPGHEPSRQGTLIYLNAGDSLDAVLARVAGAGGKIALPRTALPEGMGFYAHVVDTEGNRVGLHALK